MWKIDRHLTANLDHHSTLQNALNCVRMDSYAVLLQLVLGHSLGHSDNQRKNAVPFLLQEKGLGRFLGLGGNLIHKNTLDLTNTAASNIQPIFRQINQNAGKNENHWIFY